MKRGEESETARLVASAKEYVGDEAEEEEEQELREEDLMPSSVAVQEVEEVVPRKRTPLPLTKLFVIMTVRFCEAVSTMQIFPYVAFMVKDFFNYGDDQNNLIGYKAGYLASCFTLGQFLSGFLWGWLADKWGRRPVLLLGTAGTLAAILLFGTSTNFYWALSMRTLHGILNGNIGVTKTYLAEITDTSNRATAFSVIGLTAGLARVVGPVIGGYLAQPAKKYPSLFPKDSFFDHYPYLMPCLVGASVTLVGLIAGYFFLTETLQKFPKKEADIEMKPIRKQYLVLAVDEEGADNNDVEQQEQNLEDDEAEHSSLVGKRSKGNASQEDDKHSPQATSLVATLSHRKVAIPCLMYFFAALIFISFAELFSIWSVQQVEDGGLAFTSENIGTTASISGLMMAFFQLVLYPRLANRFGPLFMFRASVICVIPIVLFFPNLNLIARHIPDARWLLWMVLVTSVSVRYMSSVSCFISISIMISNSAPNAKLGAVNGLGQSLASLGRTVGPTVAGVTFSWSLSNGIGFPFDFRFAYFVLALLCLFGVLISLVLPSTINVSFDEAQKEEGAEEKRRRKNVHS
ncbi:protein ZINC INDUCED FACILITATOR-LIKE 1-like [Balamuthia mandrillaris]